MAVKVLIIGAGEVGSNLARTLSEENYEITLIDVDSAKCSKISNEIDVKTIVGSGVSQRILQQVDFNNIDICLALTGVDEINIVSAAIADKNGVEKVICRLKNTEYEHKNASIKLSEFGIDYITYPEIAAQKEIERLIRQSSAVEIQEFRYGTVVLAGIKLEPTSPLIGRTVKNIELSNPFIHHKLVIVNRNSHVFIPHKDVKYTKDDIVYFIGRKNEISKIQQMVGKPAIDVRNVMIMGASKIGRTLAKSLQSDYNVRLIEKDKKKAVKYSEKLDQTLVLNDDGLEIDFLQNERIGETDYFIAVTENEQNNILSCMLAKHLGAKQVIPHINTTSYLPAVRRIGVDAIVCKSIAAVNEIIKFIRSDKSRYISRFEDLDIEAVEIQVHPESKFVKKGYKIDKIPLDLSLGAIFRDDVIEIPGDHSAIYPGDHLLLFSKPQHVVKAEELFQK
jgi:trk system potassium uptake protein